MVRSNTRGGIFGSKEIGCRYFDQVPSYPFGQVEESGKTIFLAQLALRRLDGTSTQRYERFKS
jgi:hypothetical protein